MDRGHACLAEKAAPFVTMTGAPDNNGRPFHIRPAKPEDVADIVAILGAWIDETDWMPKLHSHLSMTQFWGTRIAEAEVWLAETSQGAVGFLVRDEAFVTALYLRREARGHGIGKALLGKAKADANKLKLWVFEANARAHSFYTREGFSDRQRTSGDNEEKLPDVLMEWSKST